MLTIIGAAGHLGNVLTRVLAKKNEKIRVLVFPSENYDYLKPLPVEIVVCDIRNRSALDLALKNSDTVYHLASIISIGKTSKEKLLETNYEGTRNVLDACIKNKVKKLIYVSSIHAFEDFRGGPITEACKIDPALALGDYGCTKAMATNLVLQYSGKGNLDVRVACPTGIIGPYDFKASEMGHLIKMYLEKRLPLAINGSYDFVDVRDVVNGLILIEKRGISGEVYLLPGKSVELKAFFKSLADITGSNQMPKMLPNFLIKPALLIMNNYYKLSKEMPLFTKEAVKILHSNSDVSGAKAIKELGYEVRNLDITLKDTVLWTKKQYNIK